MPREETHSRVDELLRKPSVVGANFPAIMPHDRVTGAAFCKPEPRLARRKHFLAHHAASLLRAFGAAERELHHPHGDHLLRLEREQLCIDSEFDPMTKAARSQAALLYPRAVIERAYGEIVQMHVRR